MTPVAAQGPLRTRKNLAPSIRKEDDWDSMKWWDSNLGKEHTPWDSRATRPDADRFWVSKWRLKKKHCVTICDNPNYACTTARVREAPWNYKCCSNGFCPNSFSTPPPSSNRTLWGYFFRRKLVNFLKQRFWLWELIFSKWQWSNIILRWYSNGYHGR